RKLISGGVIISAKKNVPYRKETDKILIAMLRKIAVMDSVALRTGEKNGRPSKLYPQIAVILEIHESPEPHDRPLRQTCAKRICGVQLEQHRHRYGCVKCEEKILQPILSGPRQRIEFRVQVMHFVVLPQDRA